MSDHAELDDVVLVALRELKETHASLQEDPAAVDELDELEAARARLRAFVAVEAAHRRDRDDDPRLDTAA